MRTSLPPGQAALVESSSPWPEQLKIGGGLRLESNIENRPVDALNAVILHRHRQLAGGPIPQHHADQPEVVRYPHPAMCGPLLLVQRGGRPASCRRILRCSTYWREL
jgi:hypothetical protein